VTSRLIRVDAIAVQGFVAVVINLLVTAIVTLAAKAPRVPGGVGESTTADYFWRPRRLLASAASEAVSA